MVRAFSLGRFSGEGQDPGSGVRSNPEVQGLELIQDRTDGGNETGALGIEQETKSARHTEPKHGCGPSCEGVVEDDDGVSRLQGQQQHSRFPRSEVGDQRQSRLAPGLADGDSLQRGRVRQAHTSRSACRKFFGYCRRDDDVPCQGWEYVKEADLVEILEGGGVADDIRQAGSPPATDPRSNGKYPPHSRRGARERGRAEPQPT